MRRGFSRVAIFYAVVAGCAGCVFGAFGQANGIFADFTTSMGSFTCRLEYAIAPKAVANFIGLATGQRAWLDLPSGVARTNPFYNGLLFHRVVQNVIIQAGSPNGLGTDGPGYAFPDEISPLLRFTNTGILAMANSGTNSNGSQFFITATNTPALNDGYTIFGELAGGTNVVIAISQVATDTNSKPLINVVIQSVGIRRIGTAAQSFNINAQNLPVVTNLPLKISNASFSLGQISLTFSNRLYADNRLYFTRNLNTWTAGTLGIEISSPITNSIYFATGPPSEFFSFAQIQYASSTFAPKTMFNRKLILNFIGGDIITNNFDSVGTGTYWFRSGTNLIPGTVLDYYWVQQPYRGYMLPLDFSAPLFPISLRLDFVDGLSGVFAAFQPGTAPSGVSGSFSLSP